jgi:GDP-mannose 6-dehydrogenase
LVGANREFILERIPLISQFVTDDAGEVIQFADLLVIVHKDPEFPALLQGKRRETIVYDLADVGVGWGTEEQYEGVSW